MQIMSLMQVTLNIEVPGLGVRVKKTREASGMSPTQIAAAAGMSAANLYRSENGDTKSVPRETLKRLSQALGVDLDADVSAAMIEAASK